MRALRDLVLVGALLSGFLTTLVADDEYPVGRARFGAFLVPVPLDVQAADDLVPGEGMMVVATRPGGTAATLGLQPGDVITALNQTPVQNRGDVRSVVRAVLPGDPAQVQVATTGGGTTTLSGTFQPRQPGRWWPGAGGGPAPGDPANPWAPPLTPAEQKAQILAQQETLADLAQSLAALRLALSGAPTPGSRAWAVEVAIAAPELAGGPPSGTVVTPTAAPVAAGAPAWALAIAVTTPGSGP
jgi:hypothetical protein